MRGQVTEQQLYTCRHVGKPDDCCREAAHWDGDRCKLPYALDYGADPAETPCKFCGHLTLVVVVVPRGRDQP